MKTVEFSSARLMIVKTVLQINVSNNKVHELILIMYF